MNRSLIKGEIFKLNGAELNWKNEVEENKILK